MGIISRQLIDKRTGKLLYDSFVPRPLQEVDQELMLPFSCFEVLNQVNNNISELKLIIESMDNAKDFIYLLIKLDSFYSNQFPKLTDYSYEDLIIYNSNRKLRADIRLYLKAYKYIIQNIDHLQFNMDLVFKIHQLLSDTSKCDLERNCHFRTLANPFSSFKRHGYNPTNPKYIDEAMESLMNYINTSNTSTIIKCSLFLYQFLTIFPFDEKNFQIANLIIYSYFLKKSIMADLTLLVSAYLCFECENFFKRINDVWENGNFEDYIYFLLKAIRHSSRMLIDRFSNIIILHNQNIEKIVNSNYSKTIKLNLLNILKYLASHPIQSIKDTSIALDKSIPTIDASFGMLSDLGIITKKDNKQRNRIYIYNDVVQNLKI